MHPRHPPSLAIVLWFHACSSLPVRPGPVEEDQFRCGPLLAPAKVDVYLERAPSDPQPRITDATDFAWTGAIENDHRLLLLRADWLQAESGFIFGPGRAETDVGTVTLFAGPKRFGNDVVRLTPMLGFGLGFASFRPVDVATDGEFGGMVVLAAGLDVEILHHVQIQLVASGGLFGDPGDTEGSVSVFSIGGGLRF